MTKKILSVILIINLIICSLCACSDSEGATLLIPIENDPLCLDPQEVDNEASELIVSNCYEGLVTLGEDYTIQPGVAKSWDISADGKTYTFYLRDDTKWQILKSHNGILGDEDYIENFDCTVNAEDFVFGLQRAVNPLTQAGNVDKLYCIKNAQEIYENNGDIKSLGVYAKDNFTLVITLNNPCDDFLRILTLPICMPCNEEFYNKTDAQYGMAVKYTFCNGPFYIAKWTDDNAVSLLKNKGYSGNNEVKPAGVYYYVNNDEEAVIKKLKQNSYDCAVLSEEMLPELNENKKINTIECNNATLGLCFNCDEPTIADSYIRQALLASTDITLLDADATGIIPDCVRYGEKKYRDVVGNINYPAYNLENAKALWTTGLKNLSLDKAEITIYCTEDYAPKMQKMIQNWEKAFSTQIVAKVTIKTQEEIDKAVSTGNYQIALKSIETNSSYAIDVLKQFQSVSENNISSHNDSTYDSIIANLISNSYGKNTSEQYKALENQLVNNGIFYPLYKINKYLAVNKNLSGIVIEPSFETIYFMNGSVD